MALKQEIQLSANNALKAKEQFLLETLRLLLASIQIKEKDKKYKEKIEGDVQLSDEEIISVLSSEVKKRNDAIALYKQGNRPELVEKEQKEIDIIKKYLPAQLSEEEIKELVAKAIASVGAKDMKDMGKVMAELGSKTKGKADGAVVSKIVKELLTK